MRGRLEETRGVTFELVRHFLAGMFDSELFSARGQWRGVAIGAIALALPAGLATLDSPYFYKGLDRIADPAVMRAGAMADELAWLTLAFSITGIIALLSWQSLLPGRRDYLLLAGLPIRSRQIFFARFLAIAIFVLGLVIALNVLPAFLTPHQFTANWDANATTARKAYSRFVPACFGCSVVFFAIVSLQGLLLNVLPGRYFLRVSTLVQGALMAVCFLSALSTWFIVEMPPASAHDLFASRIAALPVWFAALSRVLLGDPDPALARLANHAWIASLAAPALAAIAYLISGKRSKRLFLESPDGGGVAIKRWNALEWRGSSPQQQAILQFLVASLSRSRTHRLVMAAYAGGGIAVMLNAVFLLGGRFGGPVDARHILQFIVLYWPIGISTVMIAGLKHAFAIPAELRANWLFQITESQSRREWMIAVNRFVVACVVLPLALVFAPISFYVLGLSIGARMIVLQMVIALATFDLLFYSWQQLPFTCSWAPGKRPLVALLTIWIGVLGVVVPVLSIIVAVLSQMAELFWIGAPALAAGWLWLRHRRAEGWGEAKLFYEDTPDTITGLGVHDFGFARQAE